MVHTRNMLLGGSNFFAVWEFVAQKCVLIDHTKN